MGLLGAMEEVDFTPSEPGELVVFGMGALSALILVLCAGCVRRCLARKKEKYVLLDDGSPRLIAGDELESTTGDTVYRASAPSDPDAENVLVPVVG